MLLSDLPDIPSPPVASPPLTNPSLRSSLYDTGMADKTHNKARKRLPLFNEAVEQICSGLEKKDRALQVRLETGASEKIADQ